MDRLPGFPGYLLLTYPRLKITAPPYHPPQKGSHSPHCSIFVSGIDKAFKEQNNCRDVTGPAPAAAEARGSAARHERAPCGQQDLGLLPVNMGMSIHGTARRAGYSLGTHKCYGVVPTAPCTASPACRLLLPSSAATGRIN